jgi:hypothetical protein
MTLQYRHRIFQNLWPITANLAFPPADDIFGEPGPQAAPAAQPMTASAKSAKLVSRSARKVKIKTGGCFEFVLTGPRR